MFASNGLARVWIGEQRKKMKGTTKPLMANLDITLQFCKEQAISKGISDQNLGAGKAGDAPM